MKNPCISLVCVLLCLIIALGCVGCRRADRSADNNNGDVAKDSQDTPNTSDTSNGKTEEDGDGATADGNADNDAVQNEPNTPQKPSFPSFSGGALTQYYFSESGRLISDTGTNLNLYISWSASSNDGENLKVKFTVGIESYSIQVGARENLGKFKLNGETVSFSTDALTIADNRKKVNTDFETFEYNYTFTKGDEITLDVLASWIFNGVYGGTQVGTIVSGGTITLKMPE